MALVLAWLWRAAPYLAGLVTVVSVLTFAHHEGVRSATERLDAQYGAQIAKLHAEADKQHAADVDAARASEQAHGQALTVLDQNYQKAIQDEKAKSDRTVADLRTGALQLRSRFTCPANSGSMPGPAASTAVDPPAGQRGLQPEDVRILVSEASRADQVVLQLQACQAVIRGDRMP